MSNNPYVAPSTVTEAEVITDPSVEELAGRFTRFAAAMVDGFLLMAIVIPIQYATGFFQRSLSQQVGVFEQLAMSLLGMAVMLVLNGYLWATRGQSIGKMLTGIQIVDFESGHLLPFVKVYVYRYLWSLPLFIAVIFIPTTVDDMLVNLIVLIDVLLIFGTYRRCLHDYIAGSKVVLYRANRVRPATKLT